MAIEVTVALMPAQFSGDRAATEATTLAAAGFLLAHQVTGSYRIRSLRDLMASVWSTSGLCLLWLIAALISVRLTSGSIVGQAVLRSMGAGCLVALGGRLCLLSLTACLADHLTERVLLAGASASVAWHRQTKLLLGQHVNYVGAILVEGGSDASVGGPIRFGLDKNSSFLACEADPSLLKDVDRIVLVKTGIAEADIAGILQRLDGFSPEIHLLEQAAKPRHAIDARSFQGGSPQGRFPGLCVRIRRATISPGERLIKRTIDIMVSMVALLVLLPSLLLIALLIRLESSGPALFRQTRMGRNNLPFTVLKFRTMRAGSAAADGSIQASRGDARVTRIGGILRKSSMDELPQLLNVLGGSMSLVGPRPHPTELNRRFEPLIEDYAIRHSVVPGITGWAQINGYRGETSTVDLMQKRVEFDLEYISRRSTLFDLWILVRTVGSVITARGAY